ncbi:hypothetical protein ABIA33_002932 [Streptacidiphilus sp. MAP12-16]
MLLPADAESVNDVRRDLPGPALDLAQAVLPRQDDGGTRPTGQDR